MSYSALIFSHSITPRLQYITNFLSQYFALPFKLTSDEEKYVQSEDKCKINYSYHRIAPGEIFIHPHALLFESSVRPVKIETFEHHGYKAFFKAEGDLGFDLFASIFYLITRYEEYLPHKKDLYGRYAHEQSVAFTEHFLHLPLVNIWLEDFRNDMVAKNPEFRISASKFSFVPTYDIDIAWSFRNKGFKRNMGGLMRLLVSGKFRQFFFRVSVIRKRKQDPFDAYQWMEELHRQYDFPPIYFFLVASEYGRHDKNTDVTNLEFQQLIQSISSKYVIGLHPSWMSGDIPSQLTREKSMLEQITGQKLLRSRQHFIRFELPVTYRRLIALGIEHDHSMGYGSINGFRASYAGTYNWYDLKNEEQTPLQVHPFCFMDANAYYEQKFTAEQALTELVQLYSAVYSVKGTLSIIWHNSFLGTGEEYKGWRTIYQEFLSHVAEHSITN